MLHDALYIYSISHARAIHKRHKRTSKNAHTRAYLRTNIRLKVVTVSASIVDEEMSTLLLAGGK